MNVFLKEIISLIGGGIGGALGQVMTLIQEGFTLTTQFHQEGIAFARDVGLSAKQAQAYTNTLIERTQVLANKYGVAAEAIKELQRNLSDATGKQLMLNTSQAEGFLQMNKLVGAQATSKFTEEIMNGMGGQIDTVNAAVAKTYSTALKQGLNAKKLTDKVAQNLSMANRLSFRNGIEGITRMAAMSEKLGFNMQSIESAANNFLELDKAIENAAQMQMLGGSAAVNFGNPLTAAYEANYDPEAFAERMSNSLASYAEFDASKGIANINGMNMDFVRNIAKAMGISAEEASRMAKKQAEVRYKERNFESTFARYGLNDDQRNFLINNGQVKNGQLFYTDASGKEHNVSNGDIDKKLLDEIRQFEGQSDRQILENQARSLTSINEQLSGTITTWIASIAKGLDFSGTLQDIQKDIQKAGDNEKIKEAFEKSGVIIGSTIKEILGYLHDNAPKIKEGIESIIELAKHGKAVVDFIRDYWKQFGYLLALYLGRDMLKGVRGGGSPATGGGTPKHAPTSSPTTIPPSGGAKPNTVKMGKHNWHKDKNGNWVNEQGGRPKNTDQIRELNRRNQINRTNVQPSTQTTTSPTTATTPTSASSAASPKVGKIGKFWGEYGSKIKAGAKANAAFAGIVEGIGALIAHGQYEAAEKEIMENALLSNEQKKEALAAIKKERNAAYGSSVGGFIGAVGGGALGSIFGPWGTVIGGMGGQYLGNLAGSAIGNVFSTDVDDEELEELIKNYKQENHAQGGIVGGNSSEGDKIITGLNSGEMVLNRTQQANLFNLINGLNGINGIITSILENSNDVKAKPVGEKEYIYIPQKNANSLPNETSITVKDINVNIGGTIKLDGGRYSKNVDVNELLNDMVFVSSLKEMIKESINRDMNGGLYNNDLASRRGGGAPLSIIGR